MLASACAPRCTGIRGSRTSSATSPVRHRARSGGTQRNDDVAPALRRSTPLAELGLDTATSGCFTRSTRQSACSSLSGVQHRHERDAAPAPGCGRGRLAGRPGPNREGLRVLGDYLRELYPAEHEAIFTRHPPLSVADAVIKRLGWDQLLDTSQPAEVATLYVPRRRGRHVPNCKRGGRRATRARHSALSRLPRRHIEDDVALPLVSRRFEEDRRGVRRPAARLVHLLTECGQGTCAFRWSASLSSINSTASFAIVRLRHSAGAGVDGRTQRTPLHL